MEETFDCTGMCTLPVPDIYLFSDINAGIPSGNTCKQEFVNFVEDYGKIVSGVGIGVGFYLFINAVLSCFLCCRKSSDN